MRKWMWALAVTVCATVHAVNYHVVPLPQHVQMQQGDPFVMDGSVQIVADEGLQQEAELLQGYLKEWIATPHSQREKVESGKWKVESGKWKEERGKRREGGIVLAVSPRVTEKEGYVLTVDKGGVSITGGSAAGVFYGIQTLRKAVAGGQGAVAMTTGGGRVVLPAVTIVDGPRFRWRGMHLDCARHFFPVDFVKRFIDLMALHNMNVFHWHLTDDQGWRVEIRRWPRLTAVGSRRSGTVIGTNSDLDDHTPYGGYYSQQDVREVVDYAAARHITVVPEIDMPGHMLAALAAYPELGCTGGPYQVGHYWGVYRDVLCVGSPKVYEFVEDVLTEVMDMFPSEVIHIGGDETPTERWRQCPKCREKCKEGAAPSLQSYFTERVFSFLAAHHRRALGWDEILEGSPQDAMIMSWRGTEPGAKAAETGHDVVMTPTTHCYFDYQQTKEVLFEPSRCGGFIPVEKVYALNPAPDSLSAEARSHILGVQANLWTEYMTNGEMVEYQALPRMSALAEVQWTQPEQKDYEAFKERLTRLTTLFDHYGYTYAKHLWPERQMPNRWQF